MSTSCSLLTTYYEWRAVTKLTEFFDNSDAVGIFPQNPTYKDGSITCYNDG